MNNNYQFNSRMNRSKKKKNNKKTTIFVIILFVVFIILLITLISIITSGNEQNEAANLNSNNDKVENNDSMDSEQSVEDIEENSNNQDENNNDQGETDNDQIESSANSETDEPLDDLEIDNESEDSNIIRTYIGNWDPIGTVQTGEHETNFSDGSVDRVEIEKASAKVTGISVDEMFIGWVGNDGPQKVFTIISNQEMEEFYKLYLSWIDQEGWQVTKVEKIREFNIDEYRD